MQETSHFPLCLSSVFRSTYAKEETEDFQSKIKEEAKIMNVNEFLYVLRRFKRLSTIKLITDICLFKDGVRPMWEDPSNKSGGKWILKVKKNTAEQRLFEKLVIWMGILPFKTMEVNGVLISVRNHQTILSIWTKTCPTQEEAEKQEEEIKEMLELKPTIHLTFKDNNESMIDNSSFKKVPKVIRPAGATK
ncbi:translation initiation factor 4E [Nematocida sp. LUAm3]|nr:translation initiation factor 4E [Nematocida sp. LUAm3]KAI5173679.1 translation initiation factor 4E [Nematocida sp. LUAm2]KAI5176900.1 translation initiation factor 4E [Nematocida sp. LUAm1]